MSGPRPLSEDELHAFVDDRLDPARRAAVERQLDADPALRRRVADWREQRDELRAALLGTAGAVPASLTLANLAEARLAASRRVAAWRVAASILLGLGVGGAGGWAIRGSAGPTEITRLGMEAASAYTVFANDPARAVELGAEDRPQLVSWISQALGRNVAVPDLSAAGYRLLGGRVLPALYGPAAMLVYANGSNRITVYVQPMRRGDEAPMRQVDAGPVDGYAWITRQTGFTVLSEGDRSRLHAIADRVRDGMAL